MSDESQILVPASFVELFMPPGARRPTAPREHIAERYELCEDLAQMLTDEARSKLFELGITEADVLERILVGLLTAPVVEANEAHWVIRRLAELLGWEPLAESG